MEIIMANITVMTRAGTEYGDEGLEMEPEK
jgi:hypothetical protein